MPSKPKLTPWFPGDVKPVRLGVYVVNTRLSLDGFKSFSFFDGDHWNGAWSEITRADFHSNWFHTFGDEGSCNELLAWRGLASNPAA